MIKKLLILMFSLILGMNVIFAAVYNEQGDFKVEVTSQKQTIYNDNMKSEFVLKIQNLENQDQSFKIVLPTSKGWDILANPEVFILGANEEKLVKVTFGANSEFDYSTDLVSPDVIKISQPTDYKGYFEFPIKIMGENQDVSIKYQLDIEKRPVLPENFIAKVSSEKLSPVVPLKYTVTSENLVLEKQVEITIEVNGQILNRFKDTFSNSNDYKIYQIEIPTSFKPGTYETRVTVRAIDNGGKSAQEWYETKLVEVAAYEKVLVERSFENTLFGDKYMIKLNNTGNVESSFTEEVQTNFFTLMFLSQNQDYSRTEDGIKFVVPLQKGESKTLIYSYNYMFVYVLFILVAFILGYFYMKSQSNPLKVDSKVYEVKRVEHEGIKSLRLKVDFKNIKEPQIDELRVIVKMPTYLTVKEGSFLLVSPNHVLKGRDMYKLIWDFKKFEQTDSRIIGFTMVNSKGVLGDINLPEIEFEVKVNGKTEKYYEELPEIKH